MTHRYFQFDLKDLLVILKVASLFFLRGKLVAFFTRKPLFFLSHWETIWALPWQSSIYSLNSNSAEKTGHGLVSVRCRLLWERVYNHMLKFLIFSQWRLSKLTSFIRWKKLLFKTNQKQNLKKVEWNTGLWSKLLHFRKLR